MANLLAACGQKVGHPWPFSWPPLAIFMATPKVFAGRGQVRVLGVIVWRETAFVGIQGGLDAVGQAVLGVELLQAPAHGAHA